MNKEEMHQVVDAVTESIEATLALEERTNVGHILILLSPPAEDGAFISVLSSNVDERDARRVMQEIINKLNS